MSEPVRFLLNGERVDVAGLSPQTTLLEFLRDERRLTGTKEGCAEGDCGACTVVVAERVGGRVAWKPVNACIRLLPSVDGKAVFTVESLKSDDGALHPVQQALVDCHASQCGFCTPGFAMSLFGLYKTARAPSRRDVDDALSGNLCRCTGYRPIVDAAQRMYALPPATGWRGPRRAADGTASSRRRRSSPHNSPARAQRRDSSTRTADGAGRRRAPLPKRSRTCTTRPDARIVAGHDRRRACGSRSSTAMLDDIIYVGDVAELAADSRNGDGRRDRRRRRR